MIGHGVYLDGQTSKDKVIRIDIEPNNLNIIFEDGSKTVWPFLSIKIEKEYDRRSARAVFSNRYSPEARLVIEDESIYAAILANLKQKRVFSIPFTWQALSGLCLICAVLITAGFYYIRYESRVLAAKIPDEIQEKYVTLIEDGFKKDDSECGKEQALLIAKLAGKIATDNGLKKPRILIVPDGEINAFAIVGNTILINRGMIVALQNENELSGILAHEMGHLKRHHPQQKLINTIGLGVFTSLVLGTSDFSTLTHIAVTAQDISYSREMEEEADDEAIGFMRKSNIQGKSLARLFDRIEKKGKSESDIQIPWEKYLSSHPMMEERIKKFSAIDIKKPKNFLGDAEWKKIKQVCKAEAPVKPD